ncbi:MAG: flagellar biosynthetic protein FliO [Desulfovibrionaceae bacterium]|nr:flagellar biosynthetic protein FliO [Desulfovibrionaceae bacterium]MBF0512581.1 flagellar biosynthetic protein FliO [Desulfovibrionaceae bacterium]
MHISLALLLLLGVILAGYYILKKYGIKWGVRGRGRPGVVSFVGHLPLGPKQGVAVVAFAGKMLVLGVTEHSINLLTETDVTDAPGPTKPFEESLRKAGDTGGGSL